MKNMLSNPKSQSRRCQQIEPAPVIAEPATFGDCTPKEQALLLWFRQHDAEWMAAFHFAFDMVMSVKSAPAKLVVINTLTPLQREALAEFTSFYSILDSLPPSAFDVEG